jgi:hypothetical protein
MGILAGEWPIDGGAGGIALGFLVDNAAFECVLTDETAR